jgi:hypothetical protein
LPLVLLSLLAAGLVGLGAWLFPERAIHGRLPEGGPFVAGVLGLGLAHALFYAGLSARPATFCALALGLAGAGAVAGRAWRAGWRPTPSPRAVGFLGIALLPAAGIVLEPLVAWDARSIWFFHAKIAFFGPAGLLTDAWAKPELAFANTAYPKVIPLLGAQMASLAGSWNDHWPKAGLLVLLGLLQAGLSALPARTRAAWLAGAFLVADNWHLLWNGYGDGWLAAFTFLAAAGLGIFLLEPGERPLWLGLGSLSLLVQLKSEGAVLAALLGGGFALAALWRRQAPALRAAWDWRMPLLFLAPALWAGLAHRYGLTNPFSRQFSWEPVLRRIPDPAFWKAVGLHALARSSLTAVLPAFALLAAWHRWRTGRGGNAGSRLALWAFAGYAAFVAFAFLGTFLDLEGHLVVSMRRLAHSLAALLAAATFLAWWPGDDGEPGPPQPSTVDRRGGVS